jgi:cytidylate kinase
LPSDLPVDIHPYMAISRETGAGGVAIARRVGELLGWDVLHRELLDHMAEKYNLPRNVLRIIDEKTSNWMIEVFGKWLNPRLVTQTEYIVHLGQIVLLAAQHASNVFVGRGAQFFLPSEKGVSVYLVAPMAERIRHIREIRACSESEAKRYIRETDKGRRHLIKNYFNKEMGDPHLYDLVVNRAYTSVDEAAELISRRCRSRFAGI